MPLPDEVYILMKVTPGTSESVPVIGHTTEQGAAMEMVSYPPETQRHMWVASVGLVDDHDS